MFKEGIVARLSEARILSVPAGTAGLLFVTLSNY